MGNFEACSNAARNARRKGARHRRRHYGDARLARHIDHCVLKTDGKGPRIVKEHKMSPRKIDLAVCAVVAHDRATVGPEPGLTPFGAFV